jgi:phage head maturation protease
MKSRVALAEFLPHLPAQMQEGIDAALKQTEVRAELHRTVVVASLDEVEERTFSGYASVRTVDRDNEVILPDGVNLDSFRTAPVLLWSHAWGQPPIGKDAAIASDGYGLRTRSLMAETALANDLWMLVKGGFLKTSSIGFIPLEYVTLDHKDYGGLMDMARRWPEWNSKAAPNAFITKALLLEHSLVSVPACAEALITAVKQFGLVELGKQLHSGEAPPKMHTDPKAAGGAIHDIFAAGAEPKAEPKVEPKAFVPITFEPRLVKDVETLRIEWEAEMARLVAEEISRRMGRV